MPIQTTGQRSAVRSAKVSSMLRFLVSEKVPPSGPQVPIGLHKDETGRTAAPHPRQHLRTLMSACPTQASGGLELSQVGLACRANRIRVTPQTPDGSCGSCVVDPDEDKRENAPRGEFSSASIPHFDVNHHSAGRRGVAWTRGHGSPSVHLPPVQCGEALASTV